MLLGLKEVAEKSKAVGLDTFITFFVKIRKSLISCSF